MFLKRMIIRRFLAVIDLLHSMDVSFDIVHYLRYLRNWYIRLWGSLFCSRLQMIDHHSAEDSDIFYCKISGDIRTCYVLNNLIEGF
jgi:hypothetical protein